MSIIPLRRPPPTTIKHPFPHTVSISLNKNASHEFFFPAAIFSAASSNWALASANFCSASAFYLLYSANRQHTVPLRLPGFPRLHRAVLWRRPTAGRHRLLFVVLCQPIGILLFGALQRDCGIIQLFLCIGIFIRLAFSVAVFPAWRWSDRIEIYHAEGSGAHRQEF